MYKRQLLDIVFSYTQKHTQGILGFLSYWDYKKDKLSIIAPEGEEAIRVMTIHKSKGLEFPCVIYPYANIDIYREIEPKTWLPVTEKDFNGFNEVFINYNKELSDYDSQGEEIVQERQSQLELDAFNLLYVALTRAEQQLYIISKEEINKKGESNPNKFSGKFINYLKHIGQWNNDQLVYEFGTTKKPSTHTTSKDTKTSNITLTKFLSTHKKYKVNIVTSLGKLWDTSQEIAIEKGNLIHEMMAAVYINRDLYKVVENAFEQGAISHLHKKSLYNELKMVLDHPELFKYFSEDNIVLNERDIMSSGQLYRPDRITIDKNSIATIIDYKTGNISDLHKNQLNEYGLLLEKMGYTVNAKILVYFNDDIVLKYV